MQKLGDILRYRKLEPTLTSAMIVQQTQAIVGELGQVVSLQNGALKIRVGDNYKASKIAQQNLDLIERINERLGKKLIKKFIFEIATWIG